VIHIYSNFIIKQSTISAFMLGIFFFIAILLGSSIVYMNSSIQDEQRAEQRRTELKQLGINLAQASDYLTDEARKYAVTKEIVHLHRYWEEINTVKTRDHVIARLDELHSPNEEMVLLAEAKKNSDALVETEKRSMRLILEALDVPEEEMVPEVASFRLSGADQQLTPQEKFTKARDIMFDATYDADKKTIMEPIAQFQTIMNHRLEAELESTRNAMIRASILQTILAVIIICAIAILLRVLFTQVTSPIKNYTNLLKLFSFHGEKISLVPEGSQELRMLAKTFNVLYSSFQMELAKRKQAEDVMKTAKDEAEQANNAKSEFLATMSHEIRTPLTTIIGYQYLLEHTRLAPKQEEYTENINRAAKNLLAIINEILDFSKIEAGRMTLESVDFDLYNVVEELCSMVQGEAQRKGLDVVFNIKPDVPRYIKGDITRLKQVILNLLSNGIKFTDEGSLGIRVALHEKNGEQVLLRFDLTDTGIGISEEEKRHLFAVFTQADASTSRKYGGTGLGLAICKKIVQLMEGEIGVESIVGKGSTFSFTVRMCIAGQPPVVQQKEKDPAMIGIFKQKKFLLVEDNLVNLQMVQGILESLGFETDTAESGFLAIAMIGKKKYDVVLMDIRMPEMDGYETARRMRLVDGNENLPIIALSADAVEGVAEKVYAAGMNGYLTKPLEPSKLIKILQNIIGMEKKVTTFAESCEMKSDLPTCIDSENAIRRIGGNKGKYKEILKIFIANHSKDNEKLERFLSEGNVEKVHRMLHNIKGMAANIGAKKLQESAVMLERTIERSAEKDSRQAKEQFAIALQECCKAAQGIVESLTEETMGKKIETQGMDSKEILSVLLQLLEDGDSQAKKYFESHKQYLTQEIPHREYSQLHETITTYHLEDALEILRNMIRKKEEHNEC